MYPRIMSAFAIVLMAVAFAWPSAVWAQDECETGNNRALAAYERILADCEFIERERVLAERAARRAQRALRKAEDKAEDDDYMEAWESAQSANARTEAVTRILSGKGASFACSVAKGSIKAIGAVEYPAEGKDCVSDNGDSAVTLMNNIAEIRAKLEE